MPRVSETTQQGHVEQGQVRQEKQTSCLLESWGDAGGPHFLQAFSAALLCTCQQ